METGETRIKKIKRTVEIAANVATGMKTCKTKNNDPNRKNKKTHTSTYKQNVGVKKNNNPGTKVRRRSKNGNKHSQKNE